MRYAICVALGLLFSASLSHAQEKGALLKIDSFTLTVPPAWRVSTQSSNSIEIFVPLQKKRALERKVESDRNPKPDIVIASEAGMLITTEKRRNHAEAVRRLAEIASEYPEPATPLIIGGWPAIERRYRTTMPQPGEAEAEGEEEEGPRDSIQTTFATTAVAAGATVVRFNTMLAPDADPKLLDQAQEIARGIRLPEGPTEKSKRELEEMKSLVKTPKAVPAPPSAPAPQPGVKPKAQTRPQAAIERETGSGAESGAAVRVQQGLGELEMASNDGVHVVMAANSGYSYSDNSGASYTFGGGTPCNQTVCDGDPSLAVGKSGAIYYAWIGGPNTSSLGDGVSRSTDNGHTYTFRGMAATCPGTTNCSVADQEHIAADRQNAATGGGDRIYNVWRNFASTFSIRISCSTDSGANWTGGTVVGSGDFPRVSVGGDGFVYVAWASGGNMMLHKFSNCDAGLTPQTGWPITVTSFTNVPCPMPGLDRCNGRNILSSPKVAVDDQNANHVYYAFATSTGSGNEDVMVFDSTDGGATFPRSVRVNKAVTGHRFMPWVCVNDGTAFVTWYDRRTATAASNDLTDYYLGRAFVSNGVLQAGTETKLTGNPDPECASGWPCATNVSTDSESCSQQPQLGGRCSGSNAPCDFSNGCPSGQTCLNDRGCPKYGDYNGNACAGHRVFTSWASATAPPGLPTPTGITIYSSTVPNLCKLYPRLCNICKQYAVLCGICRLRPWLCHVVAIDPLWWRKCPQCRGEILLKLDERIKKVRMYDQEGKEIGSFQRLSKPVVTRGVTYNYHLVFKRQPGKTFLFKAETAEGKPSEVEFKPKYVVRKYRPAR